MSDEQSKKIFSKRIKFFMNLKHVSQSDLVKDLNLNSSTVSNWCQGVMFPRMDKLKLLADYLGVSVADLIEDKSEEIEQEKKELHYLNTIAAHFAGEEFTDEELREIENFIEFVKNRKHF